MYTVPDFISGAKVIVGEMMREDGHSFRVLTCEYLCNQCLKPDFRWATVKNGIPDSDASTDSNIVTDNNFAIENVIRALTY